MNIVLKRTDSEDKDFQKFVILLDTYLEESDKTAHSICESFNKTDTVNGEKRPEAIRLYQKKGYSRIANYGQYECLGSSVCFEKNI
ncbi:MAG: hypothetical protein LBR97_00030 [Dysgonamonadaceae bacterium]|nr:hypothetical protein [Dysgonamonadaceae bacterium]